MLQPHNLQSRISELSIGLGGFDFSRRIAGKYVILRRPGRLLSLVFFRLFDKKSANNKTGIYQGESRNDYFRSHAGIYINIIKQLVKIPVYHLQRIHHLSYKSDKISLFRDQKHARACPKNSIFSVQNPQSVGLDYQPVEFLRFSGKSSPSLYKNYPGGLHGLLYYMISKFQEKVNIPLLEKGRITKIVNCENLPEDAPGKNILYSSYSRLGPANITLDYTHPINVSYLQKNYSIGNSGSEIKRVIHSQSSGMQSFDKERQSSELPLTKVLSETRKERTTIIKRTIHPLLITHSVSGMAYHEHGINFQHSPRGLVLKKPAIQSNDIVSENKEQLQTDKIIPGYANHELLDESRVEKTISYEDLSKDATGKNTLYTSYSRQEQANMALYYMHPINVSYLQKSYSVGNSDSEIKRVIHSQPPGMQSFDKERQSSGLPLTKVLNEIRKEKTTIIKRIIHPLLEESRVKRTISYENLFENAPGKNILYPPYSSYLQKSYKVGSFDSDIQRVIHSQPSGMQSFDKERQSSELPLTKVLSETRKERTTIIKRTIHPLLITHSVSGMAYHEHGINFQHSPRGLVLKKPAIQSNDIVSENKEQLQTDKIIPGYANHELLDESRVEKTISYEDLSKDATGKNTLYTSYSRQGQANMALYYMHPINVSYLQKSYSVGNSGSEIKRVIHFQRSGRQSSTHTLLHTHSVSDGAYHEHGINFQYGDNIMGKKTLVNAQHGGTPHSSKELVLKKPVIQSNDIVSEDKKQSQIDKIIPKYVDDNLIKGHLKEISVHEISTIADRVYKLIERKILIEKDRRGLF